MYLATRLSLRNLFKQQISQKNLRKFCGSQAAAADDDDANAKNKWPRKIFSGVQPTGALHIGNYLGAIAKWVELQNAGEDVIYSIVDLHSITLPQDPSSLRQNILQMAATLLACGIDPQKSILFVQSSVQQHTELAWILGVLITMPRLKHLPQYQEKSKSLKEIPLGLFVYPVLQAADILLYKSTHVPVGEDQIQQIQLAQHVAKIFNNKFGLTFPHCHAMVSESAGARIRSLRDPIKKMSKSDLDRKASIFLTDEDDVVIEKIKKALTDFTSEVSYEPQTRPGVSNLILIHSLLSGKTVEQVCSEAQGIETAKYKFIVAEAVVEHLRPIRQKIKDYLKNPDYLVSLLDDGKDKASEIAEKTLTEAKEKVGLGATTQYGIPVKLVSEL